MENCQVLFGSEAFRARLIRMKTALSKLLGVLDFFYHSVAKRCPGPYGPFKIFLHGGRELGSSTKSKKNGEVQSSIWVVQNKIFRGTGKAPYGPFKIKYSEERAKLHFGSFKIKIFRGTGKAPFWVVQNIPRNGQSSIWTFQNKIFRGTGITWP